ncbi:MAG: glycerate kinase type-2 family protein [Promethearchaeota archaeon]
MQKIPALIYQKLRNVGNNSQVPHFERQLRMIGIESIIKGIEAVLPANLLFESVKDSFRMDETDKRGKTCKVGKNFIIQGTKFDLQKYEQILIVGGGKASGMLAKSLIDYFPLEIKVSGVINVPKDQNLSPKIVNQHGTSKIFVHFAQHPIPDLEGIVGVEQMISLISQSPSNTLVIALISGGGSALLVAPVEGISLSDLQTTNKLLLKSGVSIQEMNCIRKHLSQIKGGQLAKICYPRDLISLILSDVMGDPLDSIASGPTVPDSSTFNRAIEIAQRYQIWNQLPMTVQNHLKNGSLGLIEETPKKNSPVFSRTWNFLIGSVSNSIKAIQTMLYSQDISLHEIPIPFQGEAKDYGEQLAHLNLTQFGIQSTTALYRTGELTVTLRGKGIGGRNQEMLASFLLNLKKNSNLDWNHYTYTIFSVAFDGLEGNSPAMGAIVDSSSLLRLELCVPDSTTYLTKILQNNNSYRLFQTLCDALVSGMTNTNVNDLLFILICPKKEQ